MKITCAIVDDESLALDILEEYISRVDNMVLVARCNNAIEAYNVLQEKQVDLLFLDIQMPKLNGIDFVKNLENPPKIIFTTAYDNYALEGYELDAVDYMLKPISFDRFLKAVNKVQRLYKPKVEQLSDNDSFDQTFIYLKSEKIMVKVFLKDILFVESMQNYIQVVTATRSIICHKTISSIEEELPKHKFMRIHRSYIVAIDKIEAFSSAYVQLPKHQLPIGRFYKNDIMSLLGYDNPIM